MRARSRLFAALACAAALTACESPVVPSRVDAYPFATLPRFNGDRSVVIRWPAGTTALEGAADAPVHGGAAYVVKCNGSEYALAMNSVPASLSNDAMRAAWMLQKGCEAQAEALLRPRANE